MAALLPPDEPVPAAIQPLPSYLKLRPFHQRFVDLYLTGLKPTEAMRRAYPALKRPDAAAWQALQRDDVRAALAEMRNDVASIAGIKPAAVLRELAIVAFGDIRELYDEHGELKPIHTLSREAAAQIAGLEVDEITVDGKVVGRVRKVKRSDRVRALEILARHPALFPAAAEADQRAKGTSIFNIQINIGGQR